MMEKQMQVLPAMLCNLLYWELSKEISQFRRPSLLTVAALRIKI